MGPDLGLHGWEMASAEEPECTEDDRDSDESVTEPLSHLAFRVSLREEVVPIPASTATPKAIGMSARFQRNVPTRGN